VESRISSTRVGAKLGEALTVFLSNCRLLALSENGRLGWNWDKSVASFCRQLAARVPGAFYNFYSVKNHTIANNSTTAKGRKNILIPSNIKHF
jgi:hypothetical protein